MGAYASLMALASCISDDFLYSMAQSTCAGLDSTSEHADQNGPIYAVKRTVTEDGSLDCSWICADPDDSLKIQDRELVDRSGVCIAGIEVRSVTEEFPKDVNKLGPKI